MELYITDLGTVVKKRDDLFEITTSEKKAAVAPQKIKSLVLSKGIFLTTDVIKLAVDNNIDIVIVDDFGNPYVGIIHTDNYGKKSLVFDLIESYRHLASRTVFSLFTQKRVQKYFFKREGNSVMLVGDGKKVLVESFYNRLEKKVRYNNRNISSLDKLQFECHELANFLISK